MEHAKLMSITEILVLLLPKSIKFCLSNKLLHSFLSGVVPLSRQYRKLPLLLNNVLPDLVETVVLCSNIKMRQLRGITPY